MLSTYIFHYGERDERVYTVRAVEHAVNDFTFTVTLDTARGPIAVYRQDGGKLVQVEGWITGDRHARYIGADVPRECKLVRA